MNKAMKWTQFEDNILASSIFLPGVVEEVYAAQRKRDEATAARMRLANEERDDVIERLRQLEARLDAQRYCIELIPVNDNLAWFNK